jgi:predicted nucleic acid-binding protein
MLLDTSGFFCCFDSAEARHRDAVTYFDAASRRLTHNYVLAEFVALAQVRKLPRRAALQFVADAVTNPEIETVWIDSALHHRGLEMLQAQLDKSYSLCDAVSFVLMRDRGISEALTTDQHFEQAGWQRLLK